MIIYSLTLIAAAFAGMLAGGLMSSYVSEKRSKPTGTFADGFAILPGLIIGALVGSAALVIAFAVLFR